MEYPNRFSDIGEKPTRETRKQIRDEYDFMGDSVGGYVIFMASVITGETGSGLDHSEGIKLARSLLYSAVEHKAKLAFLMRQFPLEPRGTESTNPWLEEEASLNWRSGLHDRGQRWAVR